MSDIFANTNTSIEAIDAHIERDIARFHAVQLTEGEARALQAERRRLLDEIERLQAK